MNQSFATMNAAELFETLKSDFISRICVQRDEADFNARFGGALEAILVALRVVASDPRVADAER